MAITYPTTLDTLTNPSGSSDTVTVDHASQHANVNDAVEALEAKVGVNSSAVTTSHDYKLAVVQNRLQLPNPVRNASFQIWQQGTSGTPTANTVFCDGWYTFYRSDIVISRVASDDTEGSGYALRIQRPNGNSTTTAFAIGQTFKTEDMYRFRGRTANHSIRLRKGSGSSMNIGTSSVYTGTGTEQWIGSGYTGSATPISLSGTVGTSWATLSGSASVSGSATEMGLLATFSFTGTAGANDYIDISFIRVDEGAYAQPHTPLPYDLDLYICRKHYREIGSGPNAYDPVATGCIASSTTSTQCAIPFHDPMYKAPTVTYPAAASFMLYENVNIRPCSALTGLLSAANGIRFYADTASGLTVGSSYNILMNNNTTAKIKLEAHL